LKVPSSYSLNFKRLVYVKEVKMNFNLIKSHDFHALMTTLLPIALRGIKIVQVHDTITSLCFFLNAIEQKVIDEEKLLKLERRHFETICMLEATFPPTLFDLILHLTAHLAREIWFLRPFYLHQMFPSERYFGFLKSLVLWIPHPHPCLCSHRRPSLSTCSRIIHASSWVRPRPRPHGSEGEARGNAPKINIWGRARRAGRLGLCVA
jgi:hypothetical protein